MTTLDPLSDARLDAFRNIGDPIVDPLVDEYLASDPKRLGPLMKRIFSQPGLPDDPFIVSYLALLPEPAIANLPAVEAGQAVFDLLGPEVLLVLGSCSLPLAYAAGKGVQAVYRGHALKTDPIRRLCDTAQMVINVMQPGGLAKGQLGWVSARKVRLIHALVRRYVQMQPDAPWDASWGVPVNQEDQAGTLLTFTVGVLHGLEKIGAGLSPADEDGYVAAWVAVGRLLGVDDALLPNGAAAAKELAFRIGSRQIASTKEGRELSDSLLHAVDSLFPVKGYAASLSHFLLEGTEFGDNVATALGLPEPNWTRWLVKARAAQKRVELRALRLVPGATRRRSFVARHVLQRLLLAQRPDSPMVFSVPERNQLIWGLSKRG